MTTSAARAVPGPDRNNVITVHQGDCLASGDARVTYSTVLGSCISACIRDRVRGVGGMNHFLLAAQSTSARDRFGDSARYGAYAMEQLINAVLTKGTGSKSNLEIKVFGGGNINASISDIGAANARFVNEFLANEGFRDFVHDLGGQFARRVLYHPATGKALIKRLDSSVNASLVSEELALANRPVHQPDEVEIELF